MIISLPDTYTIENSSKNILSIRLNPDGLSFSLYDPAVKENYFYQTVSFDKSVSYITSLQDCFFENVFFTWPFLRINILTVSPIYTFIPSEVFNEREIVRFLSFNFSYPIGEGLYNKVADSEAVLVFNMDTDVYEFCSRSFVHPHYYHHLAPLLNVWKKQSRVQLQKYMYVYLHAGFVDIVCFSNGHLLSANAYAWQHMHDILYYILYVWQETGMNQLTDVLQITGENTLQQQLTSSLQVYLNNIQPMEIPSEAYLIGGDILKASPDLISLSI